MSDVKCPVCSNVLTDYRGEDYDAVSNIKCPRCGHFRLMQPIDGHVLPVMLKGDDAKIALLSHKIRASQKENKIPEWTIDLCQRVLDEGELPSLDEKFDLIICWLGDKSKDQGARFKAGVMNLCGISGATSKDSVQFLLKSMSEQRLIELNAQIGGDSLGSMMLTFLGWKRYD